ncbi:helix-turn-helix domain-containing protein [Parabacteroides sp. OttesenSCG-928-O15]|nr:helix-turn-helix domain-containing protein [Parabacteroides sp. OttesenSCG-928-O15]
MESSTLFNDYYHDLGIYLYLIPIISAFWAGFALLANKQHSRSQKYLAAYLIALGFGMIFSFYYDRYAAEYKTEILRVLNPLVSIFCSMFVLFYMTSLMQPKILTRKYIVNFLTGAALFSTVFILLEVFFGDTTHTVSWKMILEETTHPAVIVRLLALAGLVFFELYIAIRSLTMYFRHKKFIREAYSYEEDIDLNWIGWCIALFAVFGVSDLLWMSQSSIMAKIMFGVLCTISIAAIFWLGFRQKEVPTEECQSENAVEEEEKTTEIIAQEIPGNEYAHKYPVEKMRQALKEYFEREKPYLDPELSLGDVAQALHTNKTYLSQLINGEFQMNFYTFVNQYRIQYAIDLIRSQQDSKPVTAQLIADSGFKSRSVFYKLFRESTGYSPSDYIKQIKEFSEPR